jgi:hypothetical protein
MVDDVSSGKILKYRKLNPTGENLYLHPDGTITSDEAKIIAAQRIFKHNWYKPGGPGARRTLKNINDSISKENHRCTKSSDGHA